MATFKSNRELNENELKEVLNLIRLQNTTDRYVNTSLHINGDDAEIDVEIDEFGDIVIL